MSYLVTTTPTAPEIKVQRLEKWGRSQTAAGLIPTQPIVTDVLNAMSSKLKKKVFLSDRPFILDEWTHRKALAFLSFEWIRQSSEGWHTSSMGSSCQVLGMKKALSDMELLLSLCPKDPNTLYPSARAHSVVKLSFLAPHVSSGSRGGLWTFWSRVGMMRFTGC